MWYKLAVEFHFFACSCPDLPTPFVEEIIFTPFYASAPFVKYYLIGVAQWTECWSVNQRVTGSIASLGHVPGLQARSPVGGAREASTHCCFAPCLSPSLPLSVKMNK